MIRYDNHPSGRHFLQIPGPDECARSRAACDRQSDDRSSRSGVRARSGARSSIGIGAIFQTREPVIIFAGSGTGAWEAALVNTLSAGDTVLMAETGHFAPLWERLAERLGLRPNSSRRLAARRGRRRRSRRGCAKIPRMRSRPCASCTTRRRPASSATSRRAPRDRRRQSSGAAARRHDFVARVDRLSARRMGRRRHRRRFAERADAAPGPVVQRGQRRRRARRRSTRRCRARTGRGTRSSTRTATATGRRRRRRICLYGLDAALDQLLEEGLANVFARHARHGEATRAAVRAWGLRSFAPDPAEYSNSLTAVLMPEGHDADAFRKLVLERFDMSLGTGLVEARGPRVPHRSSRRFQRSHADGHACRRRDGACDLRRSRIARVASPRRWQAFAATTLAARVAGRRSRSRTRTP